jgi:hypothetical protein
MNIKGLISLKVSISGFSSDMKAYLRPNQVNRVSHKFKVVK